MNIMDLQKSGVHFITETIKVPSGTKLICEPGSVLSGGVRLTVDAVENGVYMCDLKKQGIKLSPMACRGYNHDDDIAQNELFINGEMLYLSQYPRKGKYLYIAGVGEELEQQAFSNGEMPQIAGSLEGGFYYDDERPATWDLSQTLHVFGYWGYDWAPSSERVEFHDPEKKFIKCAPPGGAYCYHTGQRFYFFNILEEVKEPGDYCIDYRTDRIYFIPWEGTDMENAEIILSMMDAEYMLDLDGASDVVIDGLTLEATRNNAITGYGCKNVTIRNCTIRNIGASACKMRACWDCTIENCLVYNTGCNGVSIDGGDIKTLTPSNCVIRNCELYNIAHPGYCYKPPLGVGGVGTAAIGNKIHNTPHMAVSFGSFDCIIEYNEIWDVLQTVGDSGVFYSGRNYGLRGNRICHNFVHHVGSNYGWGTMGIYNDDMLSGTIMNDNVFYKVQRAVFVGGGRDHEIKRNVFVDCYPAVEIDGRGMSDEALWVRNKAGAIWGFKSFCDENGVKEPYISRYPELQVIYDYIKNDNNPHIPPSAVLTDNILCSEQKIVYAWCSEYGEFVDENNKDVSIEDIKNYVTPHQYEIIMADYGQVEDKYITNTETTEFAN